MHLFPLFADLHGRSVLVVGGGPVAARKAASLMAAGARVTVGAPQRTEQIEQWAQAGQLDLLDGTFQPAWLEHVWLVVAATSDRELNRLVARCAEQARLFVNVVDDPQLSSFHVPSVIDRSPVLIAVSSSGQAPMLARRLRMRIESLLDHTLGALAEFAARNRTAIRLRRPALAQRRQFYDWLMDGPVAQALRRQQPQAAQDALDAALAHPQEAAQGRVTLVGAGPGDPGLLTLHGLRALYEADIILYDRLVDPRVLELARRDAERLFVGKAPGEDHNATQTRIHELMREHACAGRHVVRLKGGDPLIFGRGGEELEYLARHGIAYSVVPGMTAALACAAYAGIPLTQRGYAQALVLATAHGAEGATATDWQALAGSGATLAFYMGVAQLAEISSQLIRHGRNPDTPCALIENGTRPEQRVLACSLHELAACATHHTVQSPALLLVGEVAALGERLSWFGHRIETAASALDGAEGAAQAALHLAGQHADDALRGF